MSRSTIIVIAVIVGVFAYKHFNKADRDDAGNIVAEGSVDAFSVKVGDCFNEPKGAEVETVVGVPCNEPHDSEVFYQFDIESQEFPTQTVEQIANDGCLEKFEAFVGKNYNDSLLELYYLYPTRESWVRMNDRAVTCAVYHSQNKKLTSSARGMAI
ncbi:septum formation family protein [bacterium SCSIO 12696]|nr:septum formation family protein [bacterium SCSIO 12696]